MSRFRVIILQVTNVPTLICGTGIKEQYIRTRNMKEYPDLELKSMSSYEPNNLENNIFHSLYADVKNVVYLLLSDEEGEDEVRRRERELGIVPTSPSSLLSHLQIASPPSNTPASSPVDMHPKHIPQYPPGNYVLLCTFVDV